MKNVTEMLCEFINQDGCGRIVTYAEIIGDSVKVDYEWGGERMCRTVDLLELLAWIWGKSK